MTPPDAALFSYVLKPGGGRLLRRALGGARVLLQECSLIIEGLENIEGCRQELLRRLLVRNSCLELLVRLLPIDAGPLLVDLQLLHLSLEGLDGLVQIVDSRVQIL